MSLTQTQQNQENENEVVTVTTHTDSVVITKEDKDVSIQDVTSELPPAEEFDQESPGDEVSDTIKLS